jgi:alpha-tubulin suppressor-like RCC1 family protein
LLRLAHACYLGAMAACGNEHTAVVSEDGRLWTWGDGSEGRLGHGDMEPRVEPQQIAGNSMRGRVLLAALGGIHSAAVMEDGRLFTWGYGEDGALGQPKPYRPGFRDFNEKETRPTPTLIDPSCFGGGRVAMAACGLVLSSVRTRVWFVCFARMLLHF